ncbi:hypothetical protein M3B20_11170, partial [Corynebacterium sanguinis]|uniref:hypothetical protein n=1 Tax=Corynebacterium sanguinis TaxID=2594913 RepID=UPI0021A3DA40
MAEHIDSIDDLKRALSIEDLRNISSEKVLELVKLIQNGQVGEIVLPTLFAAAPDTMAKVLGLPSFRGHRTSGATVPCG